MRRIKLALVGRPNVGKSALFNRITRKNISIVHEEEGITRDRIYSVSEFSGHLFEVIDTAGIDPHSTNIFNEEVLFQTQIAINEADVIVMVVDAKIGQTSLDEEVVKILLKTQKKVVVAVNKADNAEEEAFFLQKFDSLGIKNKIAVSATQNYQIVELLEDAFKDISWPEEVERESLFPDKIAFIGRTNVGKSTLINFLLKEERTVVSPVAGTTRDSIDVEISFKDKSYILIDTAGLKRRHKESFVVDKFSRIRTEKTIERADICVLVIDVQDGITSQDKKIASMLENSQKGFVIFINKWDQVKGHRMEHCKKALIQAIPFAKNYPIVFGSAKTGRNTDALFQALSSVLRTQKEKISTSVLNKFIEEVMQKYHPPMIRGKRLRIYYLTQKDVSPPRFLLFVNHKDLMTKTYLTYLKNQLREKFNFHGVSFVLDMKDKSLEENPYVTE